MAALGDELDAAEAEVKDPLGADMQLGTAAEEVAAKPWLSAIVEPADAPRVDPEIPNCEVTLERVFGVQTAAAREALRYNVLGEVIWPSACRCVVYTKQTHKQRFFMGHKAEVTCVEMSADGRLVASGEKGTRPVVRVWDAQTCVELACLGPFHRQGVSAVAWAEDGKMIVTVGRDVEHSICVWGSSTGAWDDCRRIAYGPGDHQSIFFANFLEDRFWGAA